MSQISVNLWITGRYEFGPAPVSLKVVGNPDARIRDLILALAPAERTPGFPNDDSFLRFVEPAGDEDEDLTTLFAIDQELTIGQVRAFFGDRSDDDPATVRAVFGSGWGGDGSNILWLDIAQMLLNGVEAYGVYDLAKRSARGAIALRHRESRAAIKRWLDSGSVDMDLEQRVRAERSWDRHAFDRQFGTDAKSGPELLRQLGYEKQVFAGAYADVERWIETTEQHAADY